MKKTELRKVFLMSLISQVLPLLTVFLITRLYKPSDFAIFGSMTAYASFALVLCTFRLEHSLIRIEDTDLKKALSGSILYLSFLVSIIMGAGYLFFYGGFFADILVLSIMLLASMSFYNLITNYAVSVDDINGLLHARLLKGSLDAFLPIFFYYLAADFKGLILGLISSYFASVLYLFIKYNIPLKIDWILITEYLKKFSRYDVFSGALSAGANALPVIVITAVYSPVQAGAYAFINRYFAAIASFSVNTLGVLYRTSAMKEIKNIGTFYSSTIKTILYGFFLAGAFIFAVLIAYYIGFENILGEDWIILNDIVLYMTIFYAIKIIHLPVIYAIYLKSAVVENLKMQALLMLTTIFCVFIIYFSEDFISAVRSITVVLSAFYILNTIYILRLSKRL